MEKYTPLTVVTVVLTCLLVGFHPYVSADGLYFGGGVYLSESDFEALEETDETLAVQVGYTFIDSSLFMLSMELGAYDLGEYSDSGIEINADAIGLAAVGNLPLGAFIELYAKVGVAEVDIEINDNQFDNTESFQGVGVSLDIFDTIDFYLEYIEFDNKIDSRSIGAGIRFDLL